MYYLLLEKGVALHLIDWLVFYAVLAIFQPYNGGPFIWTNLNPLHPTMHCAKFHWNWPSGSYPFGKRQSPTFEQTWIPFTQSRFVPSFGWNWPSGSGEDFSNWSMYFRFFIIISPSKRVWPFIWTNLKNPLYPRMHCAKFGWNWPIGSEEDDFSNSSMFFHNFVIISPWTGQSPSFK